jgi:hypothetical protein
MMAFVPVVATVALLSMLEQPQTDKRPDAGKASVVVVGCLHGSGLKVTKPGVLGTYSDTVNLRAPSKVMKALREHEGHEEELTGTLVEPKEKMGGGRSKALGKRTKITVGAHEDRSPDVPQVPQLDVTSFRHIGSACAR